MVAASDQECQEKRYSSILDRYLKDERYRAHLQLEDITKEKVKSGELYCERTKKRTFLTESRTLTLEKHVLPEANNSKWSRNRGHHHASRFAKRKKNGIESIFVEQYFHTTTDSHQPVARLEWLARLDKFKFVIKQMVQ